MGLIDTLKDKIQTQIRSFVLGDALVDASLSSWGVDPSTFAPENYGNYIATSNGVYTCANGRAKRLSQLKRKLYKHKNGKRDTEVISGRLYELLKKVNPHWTWNRLIQMTELSLCLWGECFWFLERGANGKSVPQEIWWGKPSSVTVYPDPANYIKKFGYKVNGEELFFDVSEVIWFRYPNPINEFAGLAPFAAAKLAADYSSDAWKSNRNLFKNGSQMGGIISPKPSVRALKQNEAEEIENQLDRRTKGVDRAHRWSVFRMEVDVKEMGISPKDMEFVAGLKMALEEICRAYDWPQDLVGGQRTYENYASAVRAAYTNAVIPESEYLASEINEQLLPMFPGEVDEFYLDYAHIAELQEAETEEWNRWKSQIETGAKKINEYREAKGMDSVPWGNVWWAPYSNVPVSDAELPAPTPSTGSTGSTTSTTSTSSVTSSGNGDDGENISENVERKISGLKHTTPALPISYGNREGDKPKGIEFCSEEHKRAWQRAEDESTPWEGKVSDVVVGLFKRQQESLLALLGNRNQPPVVPLKGDGQRDEDSEEEKNLLKKFNRKKWIKEFRLVMRPVLKDLTDDLAQKDLQAHGIQFAFDVERPEVVRFLEERVQRFAEEVNGTTWKSLQNSLGEGITAGEGIDKLASRVEEVMADRIRSTPETIARTEVIGAANGGSLLAYKQSNVVGRKSWLGEPDELIRPSHLEAHRRYQAEAIGIDEEFEVGAGRGQAPGQIGLAEEDIQCRCRLQPVID